MKKSRGRKSRETREDTGKGRREETEVKKRQEDMFRRIW